MIIFLLFVFFSVTTRAFFTLENLANLLRQTSINGVIALGMLLVIITAGIDLSVGAVVAISGIVNALLMKAGVPLGVCVPVALICGAGVGLFNGVLVYNFGITPFIATLGTTTMVRGLVMIISGARMVADLPAKLRGPVELDDSLHPDHVRDLDGAVRDHLAGASLYPARPQHVHHRQQPGGGPPQRHPAAAATSTPPTACAAYVRRSAA